MAIAGIIGGLGPESTIDYYRRILEAWKARHPATLPRLIIDSLDVNRGIQLVQRDLPGLVDYLSESVERLYRAGCEFAAMAANTLLSRGFQSARIGGSRSRRGNPILAEDHGIEAVVLAGTELPLLIRSQTISGLPVLDTTELHVRALVDRLSEGA